MHHSFKLAIVAGALLSVGAPVTATVIFADDFDNYSGYVNNTQSGTGLALAAFGTLANWSSTGAHAVHAVDRSGAGNWAAMLFGGGNGYGPGDTISLKAPLAANTLGVTYTVAFDGAAASYTGNGEGNVPPDHLTFSVLRADNSVLTSFDYTPPPWTGGPVNPFLPADFTYVGDGSGAVGLTIAAETGQDGHFGGALDNFSVSDALPEPATWALMIGGFGVVGTAARRRRPLLTA